MPRIRVHTTDSAPEASRDALKQLEAKYGKVLNIRGEMAHSYVELQDVIREHALLDARVRDAIALAVGNQDECTSFQSARTGGGKAAGLTDEEMIAIRGRATGPSCRPRSTGCAGCSTTSSTAAHVSGPDRWDLVVLGGGTAGIVAAKTAASLGARLVLLERDRTGGDCLWTGCVPSKALLAAAAATARDAERFGVFVGEVRVDFSRAMDHVRAAIRQIAPVDSPEALEVSGVAVRSGNGRLLGEGVLTVDGETVHFTQARLATGATPALPPIPDLADVEVLTSDNLWDLTEAPRRLAVTEGLTDGLTRLAVDRKGRILGATAVGPRARETLGELALAARRGLRTRDLAGITHAYPTWNDGPWNAAIADVREQLARPATRRALHSLARTRRWWLERCAA